MKKEDNIAKETSQMTDNSIEKVMEVFFYENKQGRQCISSV